MVDRTPGGPIDDEVPGPDAAEQRDEVDEDLTTLPEDADPADWQEQHTTVGDDEWDLDADR